MEHSQSNLYFIRVDSFDNYLACLGTIVPYSATPDYDYEYWSSEYVQRDMKMDTYPLYFYVDDVRSVYLAGSTPDCGAYTELYLTNYTYNDGVFTI